MLSVEFFDDPSVFLKEAGEYLAARPVESNVVAVYADRAASEGVLPAGASAP